MQVVAEFSLKDAKNVLLSNYQQALRDVYDIVREIDASKCKRKRSEEKTMLGTLLYSPTALNRAFRRKFQKRGWTSLRVACDYSSLAKYFIGRVITGSNFTGYREMDFVKDRVGVEVQFGKYAFMVYNICAKMTIFHKKSHIDAGIEVVPVKTMADQMSTGVSFFEQLVWDLETRGVADIDVPVLVLGVAP
jgi:hypothetical protein